MKDNTNLYKLNKPCSKNLNKTDSSKKAKNNLTKMYNGNHNFTIYKNKENGLYTKNNNIKNKRNMDSFWLVIPYAIQLKTNMQYRKS